MKENNQNVLNRYVFAIKKNSLTQIYGHLCLLYRRSHASKTELDAKLLVITYWKETFLLNDVLPKKKSFAIYSKALCKR